MDANAMEAISDVMPGLFPATLAQAEDRCSFARAAAVLA
jgi:hypothetical protein